MRDGLLVLVAAHGLGVHLQDGVGDAGFLGHLGQVLAADAEAHDDEMILEGTGLLLLCFRAGGLLAASPGQQGGGAGARLMRKGVSIMVMTLRARKDW